MEVEQFNSETFLIIPEDDIAMICASKIKFKNSHAGVPNIHTTNPVLHGRPACVPVQIYLLNIYF